MHADLLYIYDFTKPIVQSQAELLRGFEGFKHFLVICLLHSCNGQIFMSPLSKLFPLFFKIVVFSTILLDDNQIIV